MLRVPSLQRTLIYCSAILVIFSCLFAAAADDDVDKTKQLSLCVQQQSGNHRSLIFVSTLDGKISALDAANDGQKQWSLDFDDGPMLSSNIHNKELNDNGQWVRLIPSLSGGLYKFDGENLESLPITVEHLLHSSFRYSNDLVFSGNKEVHSYGVESSTGKIVYECNVTKCTNNTNNPGLNQDILVIKRFQQTVRAIESRTGFERWNFSVGQHDLVLIPAAENYCSNKNLLNVQIKAIIPEGLVWAVNRSNPNQELWRYKFDSPIVSIWRENENDSKDDNLLEEINLFDGSQWIWGMQYSKISPNIYIGMHQRQLYVQENKKLKNSLNTSVQQHIPMLYSWQPYPAVGTAIISISSVENDPEVSAAISETKCTTALSVLYNSEYVNGNGFYLYSEKEFEQTITEKCNGSQLTASMENPMLTYIKEKSNEYKQPIWILFLSKWQGILAIVLITIFNVPLPRRLIFGNLKNILFPSATLSETATSSVETKTDDTVTDEIGNLDNCESRYLTDFEPVDCLGKGGYGVVFEAKNKIDDCHYAIKRIALPPNNKNSQKRVLREVRVLAKLEHSNIVRYFNAWIECPPCGWQEEHDKQWAIRLSSSGCPSAITSTETKPKDSVCIDVPHTNSLSDERVQGIYTFNKIDMTNDSVVIFEYSNEKQPHDKIVYVGDTDSSNVSFSTNTTKNPRSINDSDGSESIVFEESCNNITKESDNDVTEETDNSTETTGNNVEESNNNGTEKKGNLDHQKTMLSLDLIDQSNTSKSTKMFLYMQMQLCQRFSLKEWLKENSSIRDSSRILDIFQQIVDAVEYIHLQGLIHRDLKPSNIFFALDDRIKVGDFGLVTAMTEGYEGCRTPVSDNETATLMDNVHTANVGTHLYMPLEQATGQTYNYKVDIYSLGIIFFELLTPFSTDMERIMVLTDLRKSIFPSNFAKERPAEYDLLKMMLDSDPAKRPTTIGIKARPPLLNYQVAKYNMNKDLESHFELPQRSRHSSSRSISES